MNKRSSASARVLAAVSLAVAFVVAIVVLGGSLGGEGSGGSGERRGGGEPTRGEQRQRPAPAAYVVRSGDTLIAIARETGVPVARIEALNPEVDPQLLIAGEKLKLREAR